MRKTIIILLATVHFMIVAGYGMEIGSFLQPNNFEVRPDKVGALKEVSISGCEEERLTAHALLCADYLQKDSAENQYSNVIYHASMVLTNSRPNWQTVYVQLTMLVIHSSGYMPDYSGQIKRANMFKESLSAYEWNDKNNPIFTHVASSDIMTKNKLINMADFFLVQAYCNLSQTNNAQDILVKMSDRQMKDSASKVLRSYTEKLER